MRQEKLRERFIDEAASLGESLQHCKLLVVAVELPNGAVETIHNTEQIIDKVTYYLENYDNKFRLKANDRVRIVGYMLV